MMPRGGYLRFPCAKHTVRRSVFFLVGRCSSSCKRERSPRLRSRSQISRRVCFISRTGKLFDCAPLSLGGGYAISLSTEQLTAILLIALLTWTNTRGLEVGRIVQNTFTFAKTAALAGVVIVGLLLGWSANSAARSSAWWDSWANGWSPQVAQPGFTIVGGLALALLFGKAMVGPLFAQTAWTNVTFIGSEVREPGKNLARALLWGCGIVVILYVLANLAYVAVLPFSEIQHAPQNRVAVAMMNAVFGHPGAMCMAAAIMISTFGCNNGLILAGARVYYAMARDGLFSKESRRPMRFTSRRRRWSRKESGRRS